MIPRGSPSSATGTPIALALPPHPYPRISAGRLKHHLLHGVLGRDGTGADPFAGLGERQGERLQFLREALGPVLGITDPCLAIVVFPFRGAVVHLQVLLADVVVGLDEKVFLQGPASVSVSQPRDDRMLRGLRADYMGEEARHGLVFL